jgi:hypothetical protein
MPVHPVPRPLQDFREIIVCHLDSLAKMLDLGKARQINAFTDSCGEPEIEWKTVRMESANCQITYANASKQLPATAIPCLGRRKRHTIEKAILTSEQSQPDPKYSAFWDRMDQNAEYVKQLPDWVKGSPVNERSPTAEASAPTAHLPIELD